MQTEPQPVSSTQTVKGQLMKSTAPNLKRERIYVLPPMLGLDDITKVLTTFKSSTHHDDEPIGVGQDKPNTSLYLAAMIWDQVRRLPIGGIPHSVDPRFKFYKLGAKANAVAPHRDEDFEGPHGTRATWSILVNLNTHYDGGETIFDGAFEAHHPKLGGGLLFPHSLLHEGRAVETGTKYVLKTDLFVFRD